jgi:EAL domain-containing protein (putative c-di-GMP-specific phosphodiesterase class I)
MQGYLFSRPLPAEAARAFIKEKNTVRGLADGT